MAVTAALVDHAVSGGLVMSGFLKVLPVAICFLGSVAYAADQQQSSVQMVSGHLFDERTGRWSSENVFDPAFVPLNQLGTPLLLMVTIDLGASCVIQEPSAEEARAIARGERPPPTRPVACEKPSGSVFASIRYGDGKYDKRTVELSRFFSGFDGKIRVPVLFYRRLPCLPIDLAVGTSGQKKRPLVRRVELSFAARVASS